MIKRITTAKELRSVLDEMEKSDFLKKICEKQKHIAGSWDFEHLKSQLTQMLLTFRNGAVIFVSFENEKPVSIFAGLTIEDWACNKRGLNEIIWVSTSPTLLGGVKVLQAVEKHIVENDIDFLSCAYMCNGGDPRIQAFYMNNGFRLDTLNFVKNYK